MKRRNAETGKMRRSVKRTKVTEGSYGKYYPQHPYLVYLKFILVWATVLMADHMVNFRFEFLWPFSMMIRSVYDSYKYQGLSFSVFFICIVLSSDVICFFLIPMQYIFFAAGTYVWVHYLWYSLADKGVCVPTVLVCCVLVYMEAFFREEREATWRPLAAHCVGYPAASLGFNLKSYFEHRLRQRRQRIVREENEFYFHLLREALPDSAHEHNHNHKEPNHTHSSGASSASATESGSAGASETRHMNGGVKRRTKENGHCRADAADTGGGSNKPEKPASEKCASGKSHAHTNGTAHGAAAAAAEDDDKHDHSKGSAKSAKCEKKEAISIKEEKRKHKNKDKDKDSDNHKSTEQTKEQILKEIESTNSKENIVRNHKDSSTSNKEREREKEKERERENREREKEREREREREKEQKTVREYAEELKQVKAELAASRLAEAEARRAAAAAAQADRRRGHDYGQLKLAHAALQHKFDTVNAKVSVWRGNERAALERRLSEERRARALAEHHLLKARHQAASNGNTANGNANTTPNKTNNGECDSEWCKSKQGAHEAETSALRHELRRALERADLLQRELHQAKEQVRSLEARREESSSPTVRSCTPHMNGVPSGGRAYRELQERAAHLERSLSAETRVKLDLLSALGDAKRHMTIQEGLISRQEKEIEELKAQMVAVLPSLPVSRAHSHGHAQAHALPSRRADSSPLDPNASVYTPKQLCTDA